MNLPILVILFICDLQYYPYLITILLTYKLQFLIASPAIEMPWRKSLPDLTRHFTQLSLSEHKKLQLEKLTLRREDSSRVVSPNRILMYCNKRKFITRMVSSESWSTSGVGLLILRCLSQFFLLPNRIIVRLCGKAE